MTRTRTVTAGTDHGASAVEYGLVVAAVAGAVVAAVFLLGGATQSLFADTCSSIRAEAQVSGTCAP